MDGRPGPRHAPAGAEARRSAPRRPTRPEAHARGRRRRAAAGDGGNGAAEAAARSRGRRAAAAPRQAEEGRRPHGEPARSPSRRPARPSARRSGRRCASSSGSRPALDKAAVRFQVCPRASAACSASATRRPACIATRRRSRRGCRAGRPATTSREARGASRELVEHVVGCDRRPLPRSTCARRTSEIVGDLLRRRPRAPDRQARPDDRRGAVLANAAIAPGAASGQGRDVDAAGYRDRRRRDARGDRRAQRRAARRDGERVELEPMSAGRAEGRARAPEGRRPACDGERGDGAESVRRRPPRLTPGSPPSSRRPGLTALRPRPTRAACCSRTRCAAVELVGAFDGPIVDVGSRRRRARHPARARAARSARSCCSRRSGASATSSSVGAAERPRRLGPRRGAGDGLGRRRGREGARAAADRGRVVPAARPAGRRRRPLGRRRRPSRERVARVAERLAGELGRGPAGLRSCSASSGPTPPGFPRRAGRRAEAPAGLTTCERTAGVRGSRLPDRRLDWPGRGSTRSRTRRAASGRRRPPINLAACLAEAGERALVVDLDPQANATSGLGMRANGTSSYDLLDGVPLAELAKPTAFPNLFLVPSKPELAGAAVELSRRADGERYLAEALAARGGLRLRPARLPAVARPADRERARRRRPRDRAGAGRVLRARGPRAADAVDQPDQGAAQPAARDRGRAADDGRRPHAARRPTSRRRCAATSATLVFDAVVPRSVRVAEAPSHGLPVTHYDRRSRGAEAYWKVAMELVERS